VKENKKAYYNGRHGLGEEGVVGEREVKQKI